MESSQKNLQLVCLFGVLSVLLQWHSTTGFIVEAQRDRVAMFRPKINVVRSTVADALAPATTSETPENTLTELMELIDPAEESNDTNSSQGLDEEGNYNKKLDYKFCS